MFVNKKVPLYGDNKGELVRIIYEQPTLTHTIIVYHKYNKKANRPLPVNSQ